MKIVTISSDGLTFLGRLVQISNLQRCHHCSHWAEKFSKFVPPDTLKMYSLALSVCRFLCNTSNPNYSQTCSNDHFCKTTTCLRWPVLSLPKPNLIQWLLYKTTTCLTQSATTFFVPQMKKSLSKAATAKLYLVEKWKAMHKT